MKPRLRHRVTLTQALMKTTHPKVKRPQQFRKLSLNSNLPLIKLSWVQHLQRSQQRQLQRLTTTTMMMTMTMTTTQFPALKTTMTTMKTKTKIRTTMMMMMTKMMWLMPLIASPMRDKHVSSRARQRNTLTCANAHVKRKWLKKN